MKKAQGLSLNTIIIAAIVLIVLVVLWAIFTGRMGVFAEGIKEAGNCKETCRAIGEEESSSSVDNAHSLGMIGGAECFCAPTT